MMKVPILVFLLCCIFIQGISFRLWAMGKDYKDVDFKNLDNLAKPSNKKNLKDDGLSEYVPADANKYLEVRNQIEMRKLYFADKADIERGMRWGLNKSRVKVLEFIAGRTEKTKLVFEDDNLLSYQITGKEEVIEYHFNKGKLYRMDRVVQIPEINVAKLTEDNNDIRAASYNDTILDDLDSTAIVTNANETNSVSSSADRQLLHLKIIEIKNFFKPYGEDFTMRYGLHDDLVLNSNGPADRRRYYEIDERIIELVMNSRYNLLRAYYLYYAGATTIHLGIEPSSKKSTSVKSDKNVSEPAELALESEESEESEENLEEEERRLQVRTTYIHVAGAPSATSRELMQLENGRLD